MTKAAASKPTGARQADAAAPSLFWILVVLAIIAMLLICAGLVLVASARG